MKIVVCVKEVPDPDAVHAVTIGGRLKLDAERKTIALEGIPLLMNAYDEQAIEAALRLRDAGVECTIVALAMNCIRTQPFFLRAFSLGVDEAYHLQDAAFEGGDATAIAYALSRAIQHLGGADLILCGRQGSDYDQGVVGPGIAALLDMPCVTLAKNLQLPAEGKLVVTRVIPDGDETVEVVLPAVVTITNELGPARYPKLAGIMAARRKQPTTLTAADLALPVDRVGAVGAGVYRTSVAPVEVLGQAKIISADDPHQTARTLLEHLRTERIL